MNNFRFCEQNDIAEVSDLEAGMDFRLPQYRREVFLRFYEFHLKYRAHAGAVYYAFPFLFEKLGLDEEQKLWFCFINGCSQHVLTTYEIFTRFPDLRTMNRASLAKFFRGNYERLGWDTDRRYLKNSFETLVESYVANLKGATQENYFNDLLSTSNIFENFNRAWDTVSKEFFGFGRLATFSYLEYLRIAGWPLDCPTLFLSDINGSKSHRNGLCKVLGRDDLDWHDKSNPAFDGTYDKSTISTLETEAAELLADTRERFAHPDISYFTLETTLCCYKSWHRPNRRYPNVYNDMFAQRINRHAEAGWSVDLFLEARQASLPKHLILEDNPADCGLKPVKQNWYLSTGQVIMMDKDWPCFKNEFNDFVDKENG